MQDCWQKQNYDRIKWNHCRHADEDDNNINMYIIEVFTSGFYSVKKVFLP